MILRVEGPTRQDADDAKQVIAALATQWGHDVVEQGPIIDAPQPSHDRAVDPVALTALVLSIPSAALAVADLADRISMRRRAEELIDRAQQLASREVNVYLMIGDAPTPIETMSPDQLLEGQPVDGA